MTAQSTSSPSRWHELDPEVAAAVDAELARQRDTLEMIASENFAPLAVMEAQGSVLTNKYAEGYPGRRYYGGCEHVDVVETAGHRPGQGLFGAEYANVQPHSGAQANAAVVLRAAAAGRHHPRAWTSPTAGTSPTACGSTSPASSYNVVAYDVSRDRRPDRHGRGRSGSPRSTSRS